MDVETLKNLACDVVYEEIVRSSLQCDNHPVHSKRGKLLPSCLPFSSILSSSRPPLSAQEKTSRSQIHLDYYLKGIMSGEIRKQLVKKFYRGLFIYKYFHNSYKLKHPDGGCGEHGEHCNIDVCSFLDSVLDESFLQLETHVAFPGSAPNPELFSMIADWSPKLQKLKLDFTLCEDIWMGDMDTSIMGPLSSLHHLTHLSLNFSSNAETELRQTVLSLVGKYCPPSLTHLSFDGFPVKKQEILSLILGERLSRLFPNAGYDDKEIDLLKFPAESLSPICSTLRVLVCSDNCRRYEDPGYMETISDSTVAFVLRHLPLLEYFGPNPVPTSLGIQKLCNIKAEPIAKLRRNEQMMEFVFSQEMMLKRQITNIPDFLLLTKLDDVNLLNYHLVRTVGSMCQHLKHVVFNTKSANSPDYNPNEYAEFDTAGWASNSDFTGIESNLTVSLNNWPKLSTIEFNNTNAAIYHRTVLKVFGPNLKNLMFRHNFSTLPVLADFTPCICLESLVFQDFLETFAESWDMGTKPTHLTAESFLPMLKHFTSGVCLGPSWSRLFEEKTSLVSLDLHCCHIGIDNADKSLASLDQQPSEHEKFYFKPPYHFCCYYVGICFAGYPSQEFVNQQPSKRLKLSEEETKAWQDLETLTIRQQEGLLPTLLNLLPRLPKLKKFVITKDARAGTDPVLLNSVVEKLTQRVSPVQIDFVDGISWLPFWRKKKKYSEFRLL